MTQTTIQIDWVAVINDTGFRLGFRDAREGRPPNELMGDVNPLYQIGRTAAIEASHLDLPEATDYYSMQMRMLVESCPAMVNEFVISATRFFIEQQAAVEAAKKASDDVTGGTDANVS